MKRPALTTFSATAIMLMMQFGKPVVELDQIKEMLGYNTLGAAKDAIKTGTFPIDVFRLRDSQKAPYMVHLEDLAKHIDQQREITAEATRSIKAPARRKAA